MCGPKRAPVCPLSVHADRNYAGYNTGRVPEVASNAMGRWRWSSGDDHTATRVRGALRNAMKSGARVVRRDVCVFRGDLIHGGSAYPRGPNFRFHAYLGGRHVHCAPVVAVPDECTCCHRTNQQLH